MRIIAQVDDYKIVVDINWWMWKKGHHLSPLLEDVNDEVILKRSIWIIHILDASRNFRYFFKLPTNLIIYKAHLLLQRLFMRCCIHQTWWGYASLGTVYYYYYNRVHPPPTTTSIRRPFSKDSRLTRFSLFDLWLKFRLYSFPCRRSSYLSVHQVLNGWTQTDANPPGKDEKNQTNII